MEAKIYRTADAPAAERDILSYDLAESYRHFW